MPTVRNPQSGCQFGLARCDITPPPGIYHRMWGAATHDASTGVHRPLTATATAFRPADGGDEEQVLVCLDHVLLWAREMAGLLDAVACLAGVDRGRLAVTFSHTHAAGLMDADRVDMPGGDLIPSYLAALAEAVAGVVRRAREAVRPANITYATGRCSLAAHRDFRDEETGQFVCGYNPAGPADDTVLVARVAAADGAPLACVVNYACHPTTLAWQNTLISPDFPGAMREVVEQAAGVPCVFLQGASGDVGPVEGYVGDTAVADKNGRQLGHAVLSAWESLPPPASCFTYTGPVVSGATLGTWAHRPLGPTETALLNTWRLRRWAVDLPYRDDMPEADETRAEMAAWQAKEIEAQAAGDAAAARDCRAMVERLRRRLNRLETLPAGPNFPFPVVLWRMGDAVWLAVESELYNWFQRQVRRRFPDTPVVVVTLTNGSRPGYLPTIDTYGKGIYQESISFLAPGSLETLLEAVCDQVQRWKAPAAAQN